MKLLFLAKRRPQQRDLLERPYGRYFHLPAELAASGHDVSVALLSHARLPSAQFVRAGVRWLSEDALPDPTRFWRRVRRLARDERPDWIVAGSDLWYGILGAHLGRQLGIGLAVDAYDNFESYMPWATPVHALWHRALAQAGRVSAPGPELLERLQVHARTARAAIVPMAADPAFAPRPKAAARRQLGLSEDARIVGYCGSLFAGRDAETFLAAAQILTQRKPGTRVLASGRLGLALPSCVEHLGYLADADVPAFMAALDVACVTAAPNAFGRFAYPAKLYEALACRVPMVATDVPPIRWILGGDENLLAPPGDALGLASAIERQLSRPKQAPAPDGWKAAAAAMEALLA